MSFDDHTSPDALRTLLRAAIDDLLRICASIRVGDISGAVDDAAVLVGDWMWPSGGNTYSDATFIAQSTMPPRICLPPHRRGI